MEQSRGLRQRWRLYWETSTACHRWCGFIRSVRLAISFIRCDATATISLQLALRTIAEEGSGVLVYEHQEGRGIGLMEKLRAYELTGPGAGHDRSKPSAGPCDRP